VGHDDVVRRVAALSVLALIVGCGGDDRPSDADWATEWEREQALVPTSAELVEGGRTLCDELVGEYRASMTRLTPTPSETLDDAVGAWVDHAESTVFECPQDPAMIDQRLDELDVLAAEVDAGLDADTG
jgi:hypothetical protein